MTKKLKKEAVKKKRTFNGRFVKTKENQPTAKESDNQKEIIEEKEKEKEEVLMEKRIEEKKEETNSDCFKPITTYDLKKFKSNYYEKTENQKNRERIRSDIQVLSKQGYSAKDIAQELNISLPLVYKWQNKDYHIKERKPRKLKANLKIQKWIFSNAANVPTYEGTSSSSIKNMVKKNFPQYGNAAKLSISTIRRYMRLLLHKPLKMRKVFKIPEEAKIARLAFCEYIMKNNIKGKEIFFTDEKIFQLNNAPNRELSRIRFSDDFYKQFQSGEKDINDYVGIQQEKFPKQIMVAGGISYYGQGKLVFLIGNIDSQAYKNVLSHYAEDIAINLNRSTLFFQQDNASIHKANN
jgi:hypothetical protein